MIHKLLAVFSVFFLGLMQPAEIHALSPVRLALAQSLANPSPLLEFNPIITDLPWPDPVAITNAGDDSGRLFITLQSGRVAIYDGTQVLPTPFLDISSLVYCCAERGLLSVAFHPDYKTNGYFYVYYTRLSDGAIVIARYHVSADPNVADSTSADPLLVVPHPSASNHNGGQLQFGPDGYLYIGTGDGGTGGANSQDGASLLGKILRIDVDSSSPYAIPADNPFVSDPAVADEIWALGLRNPWRFAFDRSNGDLLIADVGQSLWEEVDFQPASSTGGENYGWPCYEGNHTYNNSAICTAHGILTYPVLEYSHDDGCAVTGGYRYRGSAYPSLYGAYLYGDLCSGNMWGGTPSGTNWSSVILSNTGFAITTFGEDQAGELYVADYGTSHIYRIAAFGFSDVSPSYWAWSWIERLYSAGITSGCATNPLRYCPEDPVSRAQMAVFLERGMHGSSFIPPIVPLTFDDTTGNFAQYWIEALKNDGITGGCGPGSYCPDAFTTRAEMAVFLLRSEHGAGYTPPAASGTLFTDVPSGYWAANWIEQLANEGITSGCGPNLYCPDATVTRAQIAVFLVRTFNLP